MFHCMLTLEFKYANFAVKIVIGFQSLLLYRSVESVFVKKTLYAIV